MNYNQVLKFFFNISLHNISNRRLWTGKQVVSVLVRPSKKSQSFVNLESEEKFYTSDRHFCPQDGFVAFRRGELISGNLGMIRIFIIESFFLLLSSSTLYLHRNVFVVMLL